MTTHPTAKTIVFAHANSFPAGTYRQLFEMWAAAGYSVHALEKFGHDPHYPVTNNWTQLRNQLIDFIGQKTAEPAFLIGHSLGGYLSLLAAIKRPDLTCGVVLMDSPVVDGLKAQAIWLAKAMGMSKRIAPASVSVRRRMHWPSKEAALEHFASKPAFARCDPQVLRDYIECGLKPESGRTKQGYTLSFKRDIETAIYNTVPDHIAKRLLRHPLSCPLAFLGGTLSKELKMSGIEATQNLSKGRISWIEGTHLFPFEHPKQTALETLRWLTEFRAVEVSP